MKKLFKDNNKTAMQFVPTIVSHINDGSTQIVSVFTCSEALYKKIKSVHGGSLQSLIRKLVEDATGKYAHIGLDTEERYPSEYVVYIEAEIR